MSSGNSASQTSPRRRWCSSAIPGGQVLAERFHADAQHSLMHAVLFVGNRVLGVRALVLGVDLRLLGCADSFIQDARKEGAATLAGTAQDRVGAGEQGTREANRDLGRLGHTVSVRPCPTYRHTGRTTGSRAVERVPCTVAVSLSTRP